MPFLDAWGFDGYCSDVSVAKGFITGSNGRAYRYSNRLGQAGGFPTALKVCLQRLAVDSSPRDVHLSYGR